MSTEIGIDELRGKREKYVNALAKIDGILSSSELDEASRKSTQELRGQVEAAIAETERVIKAHEGAAPERPHAPPGHNGAAPPAEPQPGQQRQEGGNGARDTSSMAAGGEGQEAAAQQAPLTGDGHPVEVGTHYEGLYEDGNYYPVMVTGVSGAKADILFLGYGDKAQASPAALRSIQTPDGWQPPNTATLRVGMALFAKYAADGKWYDAVLRAVTDHGYKVKYAAYGNVEEVPLQYLSTADPTPAPAAAAPAPAEAAAARSGQAAGKEGWKARLWKPTIADWEIMDVPPGFQPQPEDNDEQKRYKNKIAKQIKRKNDLKRRDLDQKDEQKSWKQFQAKVSRKKRPKGFMTKLDRSSIFKTPEAHDARVGVTGSGQPMTDYQPQKRFKFNVKK